MQCAYIVPRAPAWPSAAASRARTPLQVVSASASSSSSPPKQRRAPPTKQQHAPNDHHDSQEKHVVIVGGGAAGLTAAIFAAREAAEAHAEASPSASAPPPRRVRVTVLERAPEPGKKILLSGGTRANVLPLAVTPEADFSTDSRPSALRSALAAWPLDRVKDFLEADVGLGPLALEQSSGKWFPASDSARDVRDGLVRAAEGAGAEVRCGAKVARVERRRAGGDGGGGGARWRVWIEEEEEGGAAAAGARGAGGGAFVDADSLVLACGGASFPKTGTDGMGYAWLRRLGVPLRAPYPALTPLVGAHPAGEQLAGVTLPEARLTAVAAAAAGAAAAAAAAAAKAGQEGEEEEGSTATTTTTTPATKRKKKKKSKAAAPLGASRRGGFLFSHQGYTGPAVLDVSEHWVKGHYSSAGAAGAAADETATGAPPAPKMRVAWTGEGEDAWAERLQGWRKGLSGGAHVATLLQRAGVPQRLAAALCREAGAPEDGAAPAPSLPAPAARALARLLGAYELPVGGHRGYALAEVTGGGVPLEALDTRTMEVVVVRRAEEGDGQAGSKGARAAGRRAEGGGERDAAAAAEEAAAAEAEPLPLDDHGGPDRAGLHVCGELVDVHGRIGGFNFLWAWVSGRSAGKGAVASALREQETAGRGGKQR